MRNGYTLRVGMAKVWLSYEEGMVKIGRNEVCIRRRYTLRVGVDENYFLD